MMMFDTVDTVETVETDSMDSMKALIDCMSEEDIDSGIDSDIDSHDPMDALISKMGSSVFIKERSSVEELEFVEKMYVLLENYLFNNKVIDVFQNRSMLYENLKIYLRMLESIISSTDDDKKTTIREYDLYLHNIEILKNYHNMSDYDFFHNVYLFFGSILRLIDYYYNNETG
jgi:hypothetical protein